MMTRLEINKKNEKKEDKTPYQQEKGLSSETARHGPQTSTEEKTQDMSLLELVKSFPGANRKMKVYPNRSTLCSTVCRAEGVKKETTHFFKNVKVLMTS